MRRIILAQMRQNPGRLIAAGLAILLGSAFVSAVLLGSEVVRDTAFNSARMELAGSDLIILPEGMGASLNSDVWTAMDRDQWEQVLSVPGVTAGAEQITSWVEFSGPGGNVYTPANTAIDHPQMQVLPLTAGELPVARDEGALSSSVAKRLGVELGDSFDLFLHTWDGADDSEPTMETVHLTVSGIIQDPVGLMYGQSAAMLSPELQWEIAGVDPERYTAGQLMVLTEPGSDLEEIRTNINHIVGSEFTVWTSDEVAEMRLETITGNTAILTGFALSFAAIALVVAALVISNTFQVLVASRSRQLALQRCIGATKNQIFRSVIFEALILGLLAASLGILLALGVVQGALAVANHNFPDIPIPEVLSISPVAVVVPLLAGTIVAVLSAISPALTATRVSPLAALRPLESTVTKAGSTVRLVLSLLAVIGGAIGLGLMVAYALFDRGDPTAPVLGGILFATAIVVGTLIGAVFIVPRVVAWLGRAISAVAGHTARLATANAVRNPRRITTTASALFIGSALVTTMLTGAAAAKATLVEVLDSHYPLDAIVSRELEITEVDGYYYSAYGDIPAAVVEQIAAVKGVDVVAPAQVVVVQEHTDRDYTAEHALYHFDPEVMQQVLLSGEAPKVAPGELHLPYNWWATLEEYGHVLSASKPGETKTIDLTATSDVSFPLGVLNTEDFLTLGGNLNTVNELFVRLESGANELQTIEAIQDIISESQGSGSPMYVTGIAVERAGMTQVIDTVLLVIMALLAVAIVIAFVGVANTLALSVIERRKENATLRALGLTRGKLRALLATEGVLISSVGAVMGVVSGLVFGWAGSIVLLSSAGDVVLPVPWLEVLVILAISVTAGLVASVLPARAAVRTSVVVALAND